MVCFLGFCSLMQLFARKIKISWNVSEKRKIDQKTVLLGKRLCQRAKCKKTDPTWNSILLPGLYNINLPIGIFFKAWQKHGLIVVLLLDSLSFQHYVKCDTFESNCWMWTVEKSGLWGLKKGFSGSQRCLQFNRISWWPCTILYYYILLPLYGRPCFYIKSMQKIFWIFLS